MLSKFDEHTPLIISYMLWNPLHCSIAWGIQSVHHNHPGSQLFQKDSRSRTFRSCIKWNFFERYRTWYQFLCGILLINSDSTRVWRRILKFVLPKLSKRFQSLMPLDYTRCPQYWLEQISFSERVFCVEEPKNCGTQNSYCNISNVPRFIPQWGRFWCNERSVLGDFCWLPAQDSYPLV